MKTKNIKTKKIFSFMMIMVLLLTNMLTGLIAPAVNAATPGLGTVKVRVVDNVQRLQNEVSYLPADYQEPFGEILPLTEVEITEGLTLRGALEKALAVKNKTVNGAVDYVSGIGPVTSADGTRTVAMLSEFNSGMQSGWMVTLNDWFINAGANTFTVKDGDVVEFCYTCNLGADLGGGLDNQDTSLKALASNQGILTPAFAPGTKDYTLTLPAPSTILVTPTAANRSNKVTIQSGEVIYRSTDVIAVAVGQVITVTCAANTYTITVAIAANDQESANAVNALITALPALDQLTLTDSTQLELVRAAYDRLTDTQKDLVTNYSDLVAAETKIAQIKADNQAAVDAVKAIIAALPALDQLTLTDQGQVEAARTAYKALSSEQKTLVNNLSLLTAAEEQIAALLNPGGSVVKNYQHDFLLSALSLEMKEGERKEVVLFDTPRVGNDDEAYNRADVVTEVLKGTDVVSVEKDNPDGTATGTRYYVKGLKEGLAEIKVSYNGYKGQDTVIVVNVTKAEVAGPALTTDIELSKYDILYFTGESLGYSFNVTTDTEATVVATLNGKEFAAEAGKFTVNLKDGYNPIVITASNATGKTTKVYNIRAKKTAYTLENVTRPESSEYYAGDILKLSFSGLVTPVPKVSHIYNPADVHVTYATNMPRYSTVSGELSQYDISTTNGLQMELTAAGDFILSDGHIDENWFGSALYSEVPVGDIPEDTSAPQSDRSFSSLPDIQLTVKENPDYHPQLFTTILKNTEEIWPGDEVTVSIPELDIATLAANHPPAIEEWSSIEILDSYTTLITDIPGLDTVKSGNVTQLEELAKLKTLRFTVPADTAPGTYTLKGGYVWVKYGPSWWMKYKTYFKADISDLTIQVVPVVPGQPHGGLVINNNALKNKLALAAGKGEGYTGNLTQDELAAISGEIDLSNTGLSDEDMELMYYLKGVSAINLSGNTNITSAVVNKSTFDWTTAKSLNFSGCSGITAVAANAFIECSNLTEIILPEGVTSIGDYCFSKCAGLTKVVLPDTLTSLDSEQCFSYCSALMDVTLPSTLTSLNSEGCFMRCEALKTISLPDGITSLGKGVFQICSSLASVHFPQNLQTIEESAFFNCTALENFVLPESVTTLGRSSFNGCQSLTYMTIPKGLVTFGGAAFSRTSLEVLDLRGTNFTSKDDNWQIPDSTLVLLGQNAQLSPPTGSLALGAETLTITSDIPSDKTVLWGSGNTAIATVANGVVTGVQPGTTFIGAWASDNTYSGLCQVTITDPDAGKLKALSLASITLKETFDPAKYIYTAGIAGDIRSTTVTAQAEEVGSTITINNVVVADGVPSAPIDLKLGANTIQVQVTSAGGAVSKTYTITLTMAAVTNGSDYIIVANPLLQEKLALAAGKESGYIGQLKLTELAAITGSIDLSNADITKAEVTGVMKYLKGVSAINLSGNIAIPSSSLRMGSFDWSTPKSLDFSGCTGITAISSSNAFKECANLTGITLPNTITKIASSAFNGCTKLTSIVIPESVTELGSNVFTGCSALTEIDLPESLVSLDNSCFYGTGFTEIPVLPSKITQLPSNCFRSCLNLTYAAIPSQVTSIGGYCFYQCTALAILDLRQTSFSGVSSDWMVPDSTVALLPGLNAGLPESATVKAGEETLNLASNLVSGIPADKTVLWGSTDPSVAVVANGVVSGIKSGTAIIYAKTEDNSYSGLCRITVIASDNSRLQGLSLAGITLNETFDSAMVLYSANVGCDTTSTTVTATAAEAGSILKINNQVVASGVPSAPIALHMGANPIQVQVTSAEGTVTKTYTIVVTMHNVYEGYNYVVIANPVLKSKLAIAAGRESGYPGNLSLSELAAITGTVDLSNAGITDEYMAVMKYLEGVSAIDLSGNTAITSASAIKGTFDWTNPKSLNFSGCTSLTAINDNAFAACANLTGITLPDTLTGLGVTSFQDCTGITEFDLTNITSLGARTLQDCTNLQTVKFPLRISSLPDFLLRGCKGLTKLDLPSNITSLGSNCFAGCGISEIDLTGITTLGSSLFQACTNLQTVKFPQGISSLPDSFFYNCTGLTTLDLPSSITSLGNSCFNGAKIPYLAVPSAVTSIGSNCFKGTLTILDLRATGFTSVDSAWGVPASVMVLLPGANAQLAPESGIIKPGETLTITHGIPAEKTTAWVSSNPAVATVADGVVTAVANGSAVIAIKTSDDSYSGVCTVTVSEAVSDPTVAAVLELIEALPSAENLTLADKSNVEAARTAYNSLSEAQQGLVTNLAKLTAAEAKIIELEQPSVVDKGDLNSKIVAAAALTEAIYTPESWAVFADKLSVAKLVAENTAATQTEVSAALNELTAAMEALVLKEVDTKLATMQSILTAIADSLKGSGSDWDAMDMAAYGLGDSMNKETLLTNALEVYQNTNAPATDYERVAISLTSMGINATTVADGAGGTANFIEKIANYNASATTPALGTINAYIFALLAYDAGNYDLPATSNWTREKIVDYLLSKQLADGGWALSGNKADPDVTGMAISALAKYQENQAVAAAVAKALTCLSDQQTSNGGFASWGTENSNSTSMVIVALSGLGVDVDTDSRFIKEGRTPIDALLSYKTSDNRLGYNNTNYNAMASEQGFRALVAYTKMLAAGKACNIYRFEDMSGSEPVITIKDLADQTLSEDLTVTEPSFSFKVTAQDEKDGILSPSVQLNGTELTSGTDGTYICTLITGSNTITITATDAAGNKAEKSLKVTLGTSAAFTIQRVGDESFKNGQEARLKVKVNNLSATSQEAVLIVALYRMDGGNKMVNYAYVSQTIKAGEQEELGAGFPIPESGTYTIKGFVWNNLDDMKALMAEPVSVDVAQS